MHDADSSEALPPPKSLTRAQRRVLGTLIEKGLTVPESYPLTLKALTTGCNQKSARDPITNYSEDDVADAANELRELGLAAVVHTESGRTERYRHYLRRRIPQLSEPQVALLAELLLRGRQSLGDLRSRVVRMAPAGSLDGLDQLRQELGGLLALKLVQTDGPLDRRGAEVDHNLYEPGEGRTLALRANDEEEAPGGTASGSSPPQSPAPRTTVAAVSDSGLTGRIAALEAACGALAIENRTLREELSQVQSDLSRVAGELKSLREALGA